MIATQRKVAGEVFASQRRGGFAGQLFTTQRNLADKAFQAASPLVAEGVTRLTKAIATLQDARKSGTAGPPTTSLSFPRRRSRPKSPRRLPRRRAADTEAADATAAEAASAKASGPRKGAKAAPGQQGPDYSC